MSAWRARLLVGSLLAVTAPFIWDGATVAWQLLVNLLP